MLKTRTVSMVRRIILIIFNLFIVLAGFYIINQDMNVTEDAAEYRTMPSSAALPFRQLTREEKIQRFFEGLEVETSHLEPRNIIESLEPWKNCIKRYSDRYDVDPDLVGAIVYAESKGDPFRISRVGALGLMQIMPSTASYLGYDNVLDPEENINAGVKYIALLMNRFGETHALWAWNAGPQRVHRNHLPGETRKFIAEVLAVKSFLQQMASYDDIS